MDIKPEPIEIDADAIKIEPEQFLFPNSETINTSSFEFVEVDDSKDDLTLKDTDLKQFPCKLCPRSYSHITTLRKHIIKHHPETPLSEKTCPFRCSECPAAYSIRKTLKLHEKFVHNESRDAFSHKCYLCFRPYRDNFRLQRHIEIFHDNLEIKCSGCSGMFVPFECAECKKQFQSNKLLHEHLNEEQGKKPFICNICKREFSRRSCTIVHLKAHLDANVLKHDAGADEGYCGLCRNQFKTKRSLNFHLMREHQEKQIFCNVCLKEKFDDGEIVRVVKKRNRRKRCKVCKKLQNSDTCLNAIALV